MDSEAKGDRPTPDEMLGSAVASGSLLGPNYVPREEREGVKALVIVLVLRAAMLARRLARRAASTSPD